MTKFILTLVSVFILSFSQSDARVEIDHFFPFGVSVGDTDLSTVVNNLDDGSSPRISLSSKFKFFNNAHNSLFVNINGGVSFNDAIAVYTPMCVPLNQSMSMIAPFWADVVLWTPPGKAYFRQTTDTDVLSRALTDIKTAFPQMHDVTQMRWAFVATWYKVAFFGEKPRGQEGNITNTFQMALVTDNNYSFVIFNYNDIEWTTGTASGGNRSGLGGTPARAGFDDGVGKLTILNGSCTPDIINIANHRMYNGPGKFVFRVDGDSVIVPGSSTLSVITDNISRDTVTHPTTPDYQEELRKRKVEVEKRIKDLKLRITVDCDGLIERPALERECYHELEKLNNLHHEFNLVKYMHELEIIDFQLELIAIIMDEIERDISFFLKLF